MAEAVDPREFPAWLARFDLALHGGGIVWRVHCEHGCTFAGWAVDPSQADVETALACPYDGTQRVRHLKEPTRRNE